MAVRSFVAFVLVVAFLAGLLLVPAGRMDWIEAWAFVVSYAAFLALFSLWGLLKDPELMQERGRVSEDTKAWDRVILAVYTIFLVATFVVAGLDAGRNRWSLVPAPMKALAWLGLLASASIIFSSVTANTYLSRTARIQDDRGQVVVSTGPYRFVRHPMYLGITLLFACTPLALGSLWALIPGLIVGLLFVVRTSKEDQMVRAELAGYADYAKRVRFRLFPGIW